MASWKSLINVKEIKKATDKIERFWAKNNEDFKFSKKLNLQWKFHF